jgi:endonuclease/exonuclease/phosphatase family metal-dependent hydrolase
MKLMTWNIQWGRGVDGRVDLDRIVADARRFSDFDILCLQEVSSHYDDLPGSDGADQFAEIARRLPGYEAVAGIATDVPHPVGGRRTFGNMILSRLPVRQVYRHLLPWPAEPGCKSMQRIVLEAAIDTPLGAIRVMTTHLEYFSPLQRRAQVQRLRELHRDACAHARLPQMAGPGDGPFFSPQRPAAAILTGDFNFPPDSDDKALLASEIDAGTPALRDAWQACFPGKPHARTVGVYDRDQWPQGASTFDFVFVSDDLVPRVKDIRVDGDSCASDHQPVVVDLS